MVRMILSTTIFIVFYTVDISTAQQSKMLVRQQARTLVRSLSSAATSAPKKALKEPKAPVNKETLSPIRGLFFGDLSQAQKRCVPFPQALDQAQKEVSHLQFRVHRPQFRVHGIAAVWIVVI